MGKLNSAKMAYTFDDMTLVPVHSEIKSRKDPCINTKIDNILNMKIPIVASPMNTITEEDMLCAVAQLGGVGVLHRYMSIDDQVTMVKSVVRELSSDLTKNIYVAVGANGDFIERISRVHKECDIKSFCIDVANGHSVHCLNAVKKIRHMIPDAKIMAGNVCSYGGALKLAKSGANSIRCGVGSGAVCKTRQVTGYGVPQLTAIENCVAIKKIFPDVAIIADGGIRKSGDIVKSLAIGADAVMLGSILAGTKETPGEVIEQDGRLYKYYRGMASEEARSAWFNRAKVGLPSEGISTKVPYLGKLASVVIDNLCQSVKVGLSYAGANNLEELRTKAVWARVTNAGYIEGTPHGRMR